MINHPDWQKPKIKPYLHQISPECIEEIAVFMEGITTDEMDCDTCIVIQEILSDEIEDEELINFAIDNLDELFSYIAKGNLNIRMHRDITGELFDALDYDRISYMENAMKKIIIFLTIPLLACCPK
jgi:hypothetical protein